MSPWSSDKDPQADREARNYDNPIPSREYIAEYLAKVSKPVSRAQLARAFALDKDSVQEDALRRRLRAMERDGQLIRDRKGDFGLVDKMDLIRGRVMGHRDGFGFVLPEEGGEDLFLNSRQMRLVFDGDRVLARVSGIDRRGRKEGNIVEVLEHNTANIVGRFFKENGVTFVEPDNRRISQDILIASENCGDAVAGQIVVVEITVHPGIRTQPQGKIINILGDHMAPGMEIDIALRAHEIPFEWPGDVLRETDLVPSTVEEAAKIQRVDMRNLPLVTIDGEDARDFDDAVYCEKKKSGGWRLTVAIADVSHYVNVGSALDQEAKRRGNSVYFPEKVIPMLPEVLSNGLCSLNPNIDRLCMVCEASISASGKVSRYRFYEGVMRSRARLTYTEVGAFIASEKIKRPKGEDLNLSAFPTISAQPDLVEPLRDLNALFTALRSAREERGAIDFETNETRIVFGDDRKIEEIVPVDRNDAHKLIEEMMLCANVCTAKLLEKYKLPGLYRNHDGPKDEKLTNLRAFLGELGITLPGKAKPQPKDFQAVLSSISDRPDAHLIQTVMLRSMSRAAYSPENTGHFGLGYKSYAHFTSPIRRYPDLLVHRAIRYLIHNNPEVRQVHSVEGVQPLSKKEWLPYDLAAMLVLGESSSSAERRADDATRDVVDWLKCEFMSSKVGDVFSGVISSVTAFGLFVELKDVYVEGLVHISNLPGDYYHFDPIKHRLNGERTGVSYRLGDELMIKVAKVNLDDRKIDFDLLGGQEQKRKKKPSKHAKSVRGGRRKSTKEARAVENEDERGSKEKRKPKTKLKLKKGVKKSAKKGAKKGAENNSKKKAKKKRCEKKDSIVKGAAKKKVSKKKAPNKKTEKVARPAFKVKKR
ncbi:MAG: ribonuclease R [Pseudomonadales bacterium]|nr:ribonuclease R [Pseudomonadales bacterium]